MDLGLLMKVNQYKQSQFYQNAERINTQFAELNSLDIANKYQKQHAEEVVNNLSTQIREMGGLDYSDPNIANTISGYAGSVYKDPAIINGIMSTKAIRAYDANTAAMKNNPKLAQYYDPAREIYDKYAPKEVNPNSQAAYLTGDINSRYDGPTAPAPYLGNDFDILAKEVNKLHPNIETRYGPSGNKFFIDVTTNTKVDPYTIRKMVDGRIDGKVADQLNVHAWYNYDYLSGGKFSKEQGIGEFNSYYTSQLNKVNEDIEVTKKSIITEPDNIKRAQLEAHLEQLENEHLPEVQKAIKKGASDFSDLWDKNKSAALYNLYTNKLKDDIATAYSYDQETHKLVVNQEEVANARWDIEAAKLDAYVQRNADGTKTLVKKTKPGELPLNNLLGQMQRDFNSAEDLEPAKVTQETVTAEIDGIKQQMNGDLRNILFETARMAGIPGMFDDNPDNSTINNDPNATPVTRTDILKKVAQLAGDRGQLSKEDIDTALADVKKYGDFDAEGNYKFKGTTDKETISVAGKPIVSLTAPQITFFNKVKGIMDEAADGKDITGRISNAGAWRNYLNKFSINNNVVKAKEKLLETAHRQVENEAIAGAGLTKAEEIQFRRYLNNPKQFYGPSKSGYLPYGAINGTSVSPSGVFNPDNEVMRRAVEKVRKYSPIIAGNNLYSAKGLQEKVDELLNRTADRKTYYSVILPDDKADIEDQYRITNLKNYVLNDPSLAKLDVKKKEDISPIAVVTDGLQYFVKVSDASDNTKPFVYIPITEENLDKFKIGRVPYPQLEQAVSHFGRLPEPIYIDPMATNNQYNKQHGFTGPIKIDIINMNASGDRNNDNFTPAILYKGKQYLYRPGNSKSANAALQIITNTLQNNQDFPSLDQPSLVLKDGSTYTESEFKKQFNLSDEEIQAQIAAGNVTLRPSLLDAIQTYNNQ
jgi:hypothetical protein